MKAELLLNKIELEELKKLFAENEKTNITKEQPFGDNFLVNVEVAEPHLLFYMGQLLGEKAPRFAPERPQF